MGMQLIRTVETQTPGQLQVSASLCGFLLAGIQAVRLA